MTETYDADDTRGSVDTRKTLVRKFSRNSEIDVELAKALKIGEKAKGRRIAGKTDLTDVPSGLAGRVMPLPYVCPKCGTKYMNYAFKCNLCQYPTPLGNVNWRR